MAFYDEMAGLALEMLTEFGQPVTLRDTVPGEYDPITGGTTPGTVTEQVGSCILQEYGLQESGAANLAGSDIRQNDKKILIAAKGLTPPTLSTQVIAGGHTWTAVNIKEINPAGTPLVYEIQGRR
ncbi:hypothetical protein [Pelagibacterium sp.]|uniref:hypothetical protein n=1 Tax=Pelagibacterium sp. TaxID=1967288 RepID=UPI003A933736